MQLSIQIGQDRTTQQTKTAAAASLTCARAAVSRTYRDLTAKLKIRTRTFAPTIGTLAI